MVYLAAYAAALVAFFALDFAWLSAVMKPMFEARVGGLMKDDPDLAVAGGFYVVYVAGIVWFAVTAGLAGQNWGAAALNGAILGLLAYGTYEATNMATLKGWTLGMMATDIAWGTVLTAVSAVAGYAGARLAGG